MGADPFTIAAITAAVGTGVSVSESRQAAKQQRKAQKLSQRRADLEAARARREQVREARIRRAEIISRSTAVGGAGSSAEAGATGSVQSQLGANLGFLGRTQQLSRGISQASGRAAQAQSRAATAGAIGGFAGQFADFKQTASKVKNIFQS